MAIGQARGAWAAAVKKSSVAIAAAALVACGGGGGGGGSEAPLATGSPGGSTQPAAGGGAPPATSSPGATGGSAAVQRTDFQVNTATAGSQSGATIARLANGGYVAVWDSALPNSGGTDVRLQRFDAQGQPLGSEQVVTASGVAAQVTAFADGRFLVAWRVSPFALEVDGLGRMFDAAGSPIGGTITIGTSANGFNPRPMALPDGSFVGASDVFGGGKFGPDFALVAHFAADGTPVGTPTRLESQLSVQTGVYSPNNAGQVRTALLADGRIAAVWVAWGTNVSELRLSLFDAQVQPVGGPAVLDTRAVPIQSPSIAVLADGRYAVTWVAGVTGQPQTAFLELFDAGGSSLGRQELATSAGATLLPRLTALADGSLAVAWSVTTLQGGQGSRQLLLRRFDRTGAPIGTAQQVDTATWTSDNLPYDSLGLAPTAGDGVLLLYGRWSAAQSWDVRATVR